MCIDIKSFGLSKYVSEEEIKKIECDIVSADNELKNKSGKGSQYTGWLSLPQDFRPSQIESINCAAKKIISDSKVFVVIGIGGSYLGARAAIEFIFSPYYNQKQKATPEIYFVGNDISYSGVSDIIEIIADRDFSINVISKSGGTIEPAIAFRIFKDLLEKKYGEEGAKSRIYATTDPTGGALRAMCKNEGYISFDIPSDIGGRYSVLSAVGLLPLAVCGADIEKVFEGAKSAENELKDPSIETNSCYRYAAIRHLLYSKGKNIEILCGYDARLTSFGEWYRQLFAESHGKEGKGIFPAAARFTTDLHSIGQYIQQGERNMFETIIWVKNPGNDYVIIEKEQDCDGLNYLAGKGTNYINKMAFEGTILAHVDGDVPNIVLTIDSFCERDFGKLVFFFEKACAIGGYLLNINPFDQPGVEFYKKNMIKLLNKHD